MEELKKEYDIEIIYINNAKNIVNLTAIDVNGSTYKLEIIKNFQKEDYYLLTLKTSLIIINLLIFLISIISGRKTSKKVLKPINVMTQTVKNISLSKLDTRLNLKGSQDELRDLSKTVNKMLDRIQESYEKENRFVSDASHELRTPIAVIQGYANLLDRWGKDDKEVLEEGIRAIINESSDMKELVEKLLFLARADKNTQNINKENINISIIIEEVVKETKMIHPNHNIYWDGSQSILIFGDKKLIKEMFRIFVDNSTKYTEEGGVIKISSTIKNNKLILSISDNGIGIKKDDLPYIFDRFYRADKSRTKNTGGNGLGLSIAKWIVMVHEGTITVQSKIGEGTNIIMTFDII